uniref:Uncharacterized protein n=1 Tax=Cyanistes caeruleus TaxID=156563 RepID=A0A8C0ZIS2_CYACU
MEEHQLQHGDSAQPCATTATLVPSSGAGGLQGVGGTKPILNSPSPSHLELLTQLGLHIQADQHRLSEACGGTQDTGHTRDVLLGTPTWPSINPAWISQCWARPGCRTVLCPRPQCHLPPAPHQPGQTRRAAWAAWQRTARSDVAKLHSLLWSPPPAPRNQAGLSPHCRGTPLRAVHPPASAPPAPSEPGHQEKLCGWRHPGSDACSKGWAAPGRGRSQSVSRLSTAPDGIRLSSNLGTERWKNQSAPATPAAPQGPLVRGRSSSVSGSPVLKSAKAAGGCKARPPWK